MALERYLENPERYADLINGYRFQGRQVVKPEDVVEKDTRLSGRSKRKIRKKGYTKRQEHVRQRDMVRKVIFGTGFAVIALGNQKLVDFAMPIRAMIEDALEYDKQVRAIKQEHIRKKDLKGSAEFVGKFSVRDKIIPTITIVVYLGEEEWNGPRNLLDILNLEDLPKEIRQLINGYPLHILDVHKFVNIECFHTDLREVFGVIQNSSNKECLLAYAKEHEYQLSNLDEAAYDVIAAVTGNVTLINNKEEFREGDDAMNLCKGMVEWAEQERQAGLSAGRLEGRSEGRLEGRQEGRLESKSEIAKNAFSMGFDVEKVAILCGENPELIKKWFDDWASTITETKESTVVY